MRPSPARLTPAAKTVSNLQIIEELCGICEDLAKIVTEQQKLLAQHEALVMVEDIERVKTRYAAMIGDDEWPDVAPDTGE